jgi:hypothetical protein
MTAFPETNRHQVTKKLRKLGDLTTDDAAVAVREASLVIIRSARRNSTAGGSSW